MDKLAAIRIYDGQDYSDEIPVTALAENVQWDESSTLIDILGSINLTRKGSIQDQIDELNNRINNIHDSVISVNGKTGTVVLNAADVGAGTGNYNKPINGIPKTDLASSVQTSLGKADTALQSYTETDPTVPAWAKQPNKPTYTAQEVGALPADSQITVEVDDTLSIQGAAADAKAVGDALASNSNVSNIIASTYNDSNTYNIGSLVLYDGLLYRCRTKIETPETWTRSHWDLFTIAKSLTPLELGFLWTICDTVENDLNKIVSLFIYGDTQYNPKNFSIIGVHFYNAVPANSTLNINNTGAKPIYKGPNPIGDNEIKAGDTAYFMLNGIGRFEFLGVDSYGTQIKTIKQDLEIQQARAETAQALKINKPVTNPNGTQGQILQTDGQGGTSWVDGIADEQIADAVTDWLEEHVDPVGAAVVVDNTLTIEGAAADAKKTGDEISSVKEELKSALIIDNNYNYLVNHPFNSTTSNGVTFTRQEDGSVKVSGTTTASGAYGYFFNATNKYPSFITPGKQYYLDFHGVNVRLRIAIYKDGEWASPIVDTKNPCVFEVPSELIGFRIQLIVMGNGTVVDETVYPKIVEIKSEEQKKFERDIIGAAPDNEISVLFVGNSLTQDGIAYLPWLLRTYYPEVNFRFYMWYMGSYTLADHYTRFLNNGSAQRFSVAENTASWTNYIDSKTMAQILSSYTFNIVCMQEYFNNKSDYTDADLTDWNNCRDYITSNYHGGNALEFISLFHAPARAKADDVFSWTKSGNELILKKTVSQDMLSIGIAIYRALSTDLDNLGDLGHLSPDGFHTQEGLPCLLQSYVAAMWIFDRVGLTKSVYGCPARITTEIYNSINVPGPNLGSGVITGTDAQNLLAQEVAIKAYKEGLEIANAVETTSEQTLISMQKSILNDTHIQWFIGKNINSEGIIQDNTSAALSNTINVSEGTQIKRIGSAVDSSQKTLFLYVDAFENMVFKGRTSLAKLGVYTVPHGVDSICFGFARAASQGVDMTVQDVENYFGVEWKFATASYTTLKSGNEHGEYIDNLLEKFCVFSSGTRNGITYDLIDNEAHAYYVHGSTSDSISYFNFYNGMLPDCIERGKRYFAFYENSAEARNCHLKFLFYDKDGVYTNVESVGYPYAFTIPDDAFTMVVRLYVTKNQTVDTTIKYLKLVEAQEQKMLVPYIISFVDDDASTTNYVEKYYNSCKRNGINGNYAVITNHLDRGTTDPDVLIGYEDDGMGMLIHCSDQSYSLAPEWMDRDYDGCRKNLFKGVRAMEERGFVNFRYWVMPYGYVNDDFKRLAVDAGMKCMISSANFRSNGMEDADRYYIKRYSLNPSDTGSGKGDLADAKAAIDGMQNLPSCWLIITTHYNEWGSVTWDSTVDSTGYPVGYARMNEIIQYAKASGAQVLTVPEAWRFYEPIIEANEQRYNKIRP